MSDNSLCAKTSEDNYIYSDSIGSASSLMVPYITEIENKYKSLDKDTHFPGFEKQELVVLIVQKLQAFLHSLTIFVDLKEINVNRNSNLDASLGWSLEPMDTAQMLSFCFRDVLPGLSCSCLQLVLSFASFYPLFCFNKWKPCQAGLGQVITLRIAFEKIPLNLHQRRAA